MITHITTHMNSHITTHILTHITTHVTTHITTYITTHMNSYITTHIFAHTTRTLLLILLHILIHAPQLYCTQRKHTALPPARPVLGRVAARDEG